MGRVDTDSRGSQLHQGPHHRTRQAGQPRQGQAGRLHLLLQTQHSHRSHRSQGQQPRCRRRHGAGARLRWHPGHPVRVVAIVRGKLVSRDKGKRADYISTTNPTFPSLSIEAKDNSHAVGGGMPSRRSTTLPPWTSRPCCRHCAGLRSIRKTCLVPLRELATERH